MTSTKQRAVILLALVAGATCCGCQPWPPQSRILESRYFENTSDFERIHQIVQSEDMEKAYLSFDSEGVEVYELVSPGKYDFRELKTAAAIELNQLLKNVYGTSVTIVDGETRIRQKPEEIRGARHLIWYARSDSPPEVVACELIDNSGNDGTCRVPLDDAWSIQYVW